MNQDLISNFKELLIKEGFVESDDKFYYEDCYILFFKHAVLLNIHGHATGFDGNPTMRKLKLATCLIKNKLHFYEHLNNVENSLLQKAYSLIKEEGFIFKGLNRNSLMAELYDPKTDKIKILSFNLLND